MQYLDTLLLNIYQIQLENLFFFLGRGKPEIYLRLQRNIFFFVLLWFYTPSFVRLIYAYECDNSHKLLSDDLCQKL